MMTFSYLFICNPIRSWHQLIFVKSTGCFFPNHLQNIGACQIELSFHPRVLRWKKILKHTSLSTGASHEPPKPIQWRSWTLYCDVGSWSFLLCIAQVGDEKMWVFCLGMLGIYVQDWSIKSISGKLVSVDGSEKPARENHLGCIINPVWEVPTSTGELLFSTSIFLEDVYKCEKCVKNKIQRLSWHRLFRVVDWLLVTNVFVVWHAGMGAHPPCENIVIQNT